MSAPADDDLSSTGPDHLRGGIPRSLANAAGVLAIVSWGGLGLLGQKASSLPPFFVLAVCFALAAAGGSVVLLVASLRGAPAPEVAPREIALGGAFMFGYHALYFSAFHHAPAIEVTLLNYLWPAFVIAFGNALFGLGSGWRGLAAAGLGFGGVALLLGSAPAAAATSGRPTGLALALAAAAVWGVYCNLRRAARGSALAAVTAICGLSALLSAAACVASETLPSPDRAQMAVLLLLAAGPAGGAFFLWDLAMRYGNAAGLAVLSYAAPLISTALLVASGLAEPSWRIAGATALIAAGGVAGLRRREPS